MNCLLFIALQIGIPSTILSYLHAQMWGFNLASTILIWFIFINLLICFWELALYYCHPALLKEHERRKKLGFYKATPEGKAVRATIPLILFADYPLSEMCTFEFWVHIWTEYCRYDDAYAYPETFQFNIDVCNGHSTPISCILFLYSMFFPIFSPQVTGLIGAILFYQKWYGTLIYLFVFHNCKKGAHLSWTEYLAAVLATNGVWFTVPLYGVYVSYLMITSGTYAAIH